MFEGNKQYIIYLDLGGKQIFGMSNIFKAQNTMSGINNFQIFNIL